MEARDLIEFLRDHADPQTEVVVRMPDKSRRRLLDYDVEDEPEGNGVATFILDVE